MRNATRVLASRNSTRNSRNPFSPPRRRDTGKSKVSRRTLPSLRPSPGLSAVKTFPGLRWGLAGFLLICCCAIPAAAREEVQRDFHKTVALTPGRSFRIENSNGNVTVRTQSKGEVDIHATIRCSAGSASEARSFCGQIQIVVDAGSGVSVHTQYPSNWSSHNLSYGVHYDVTMPETAPLELRNRFGEVNVANLHAPGIIRNSNGAVILSGSRGRQEIENAFGAVEVRGNEGDLSIRNGNGEVSASDIAGTVDITNRFGQVRVTHAGRGVTIHGNNGGIEVENVTGAVLVGNSFGGVVVSDAKSDVTVQNQNGSVRVTGVAGTADLRTSFDRVTFSRIGKMLNVHASNATVSGDTVGESATVETTFGSVDLRGVKAGARVTSGNSAIRLSGIGGDVYAKTSFAGIDIGDVAGAVTVESMNGSVTVVAKPGQRCQPISLNTSFSPIRVTVPNGIGYNVIARTSFGQIHSQADMTISGNVGSDTLNGKISGGGCELRLTDQNGSIDILKGK
jgi:hypothetical protein